ncbi:MAG: DNA recombination protein RmuC [Salibacteraceae bacterium]
MLEYLVFLIVGLLAGLFAGYFFGRSKSGNVADNGNLETELERLRNEREQAISEKGVLNGRLEKSIEEFQKQDAQIQNQTEEIKTLTGKVNSLEAEKKALQDKLNDQKSEIERLNERFKSEFKVLADEILKQNSKDFSSTSKKEMDEMLRPFKERIKSFEERVNEVYKFENDSRNKLYGQVLSLIDLNKKISEEANNLTKALKGDSQKQGAWGEFILESILESSGLEKGVEYETQTSTTTEEGRLRPDVVVNLPDDQHIVIDSKVSLKAYESFVNAEDEESRQRYLAQHVASLKTHVKGLSEKNYQSLTKGQSLDFVLMFVPIEAGFSEALRSDNSLYNYAWDKRIVIVSPTTLLATLRTIASVWKQEKQNRNVVAIAEESGKMYDKFVGFLEDLDKINRGITTSAKAYDDAVKKLNSGTGNLVRRAEKIKELGAKTSKDIPDTFLG